MINRNHTMYKLFFSVLVGFMLLALVGWLLTASAAPQDEDVIVLDGVRDSAYTAIAFDPIGDLADPGPGGWTGTQWTDLSTLYVAANATTLYVYVDTPNLNNVDSTGQIGLVLEVDGQPNSGGAGDPWGNAITFAFSNVDGFPADNPLLPDYAIRGNIYGPSDNGWTELRTWNGDWNTGAGVNWGGINGNPIGTNIAYGVGQGIEFAIPLADIGNPDPAAVRMQFFTTQSGASKGAYDTLPSDDQSTGWDDPTAQANLVSIPLATDPLGDLDPSGPGGWDGVAWTDMSRLHIWADDNSLQLLVPMAAYSTTLSQGQFLLAIDTKSGGGAGDPWGNAITFAYTATHRNLGSTPVITAVTILPDYIIRGNIFGPADNGWTELRAWNGSNWDTGAGTDWGGIGNSGQPALPGSNVAWSNGEGLRLRIPFSDIGISGGDRINLQFMGTQGGGGKGAYDTVPEDDQSQAWDDPTTHYYLATYDVPVVTSGGAGHDNNIFWDDLGHDSRDTLFRSPGGPVYAGTAVTLRLRAASNDLTAARVRLYNDRANVQSFLDMSLVADDGTYEWWEATLPVSNDPTIYWYRFIAIDGTATAYYEDDAARDGGWGQPFASSPDNSWQLTMYDPAFNTPDWVKDAVMYQIFPDRFRNGDASNDPPPGRFFYNEPGGTIVRSDPSGGTGNPWNTVVCDPRDAGDPCAGTYSKNFYGGDLQGVIEKLDYLQSLGVTTIYFNPIFESPSNHKYDTADYGFIAEDFGDLQTFITLSQEVHNRGMYIVLDGVFNHTSSDSIYFDRYGRYAQVGACESHTSPYRDWYYFTDVTPGTGPCVSSTGVPNAANYTSWFGFDSLPKLNAANPEVRDLIFAGGPNSVAMQWLQHADGWRFDVGGDIDPGVTNDPDNDFWEQFRATTRAQFPDSYMVIEEWGNASAWLLGDEMDATMNYQYSSAMLSFWRDTTFTDNDHNTGSSAGELTPLTPSQLDGRLHNWIERYPPEALYAMMNLLGSHDTNRPLFMLDHNAANGTDHTPLLDPDYDWSDSIARLKGVVLLQMTLPGAPTIYYGDEVGLVGPTYYYGGKWEDDPYNRQPYPWLDEGGLPFYTFLQNQANQDELFDYYSLLTSARNAHPALRTGSFDTLLVDDANNLYGYGRKLPDHSDAAIVILNRAGTIDAPQDQTVTLDVSGYLPYGTNLVDVLSEDTVIVDGSGQLTVDVPGQSGVVLILSGTIAAPPSAVVDLAVTAVRNQEIDLEWSAAAGATSYDLYRSPVSGGGYVWIANTTNLTYTDTGLQNATPYHFVVVSRDDVSGLVSGYSNEAVGIPAHDLSTAWYNLQSPPQIFHTISAITPTENIYGQLWINDYTGGSDPAQGISAQIGYAIAGTPPISTSQWTWVDMAYDSAQGNNDQYVGNLLPDVVGDFDYITRWSSDGGNTWYRSDLSGPGDNGSPGLLHVLASGDTTAPMTTTLYVDSTTAASVSLSWDAVSDPDVAGYELYRQNVAAPGYERIAQLFGNVTSYEDTAVTTGETYEYYVLAFDTSFNRADPSNVVQATAEPRLVEVTFQVAVPAYTPGAVYLVGDIPELGPWNPGLVPMNQVGNTNVWTYTLDILDGTQMQYKYTRGSWDTVESWGSIVVFGNRHLTIDYGTDGTQLVDNTATDWGNGPDDEKAVQYWRDPIVVAYAPVGTNVPVSSTVVVTWSIPMQPNTTFEVAGPDGPVSGAFAYDSDDWTVTFTPDADLATGAFYTVTVAGAQSVGVPGGDSGVQQFPVTWTFLTTPEAIQAGFSSNSPIMVGDTAVFTNTTTGQQPISYEWEFGDGNTSTDEHPTHVYAAPGTYTVTLTATNDFETAVVTGSFVVNPEALTAGFVSNSPITVGDTAVFTNTTTGSGPITYTWDFGDGGGSNETNPTHLYAEPGTYSVVLTATNDFETAVITDTFVVNPVPLVAAFSSNSPITVGGTAVFTNSTTGSGPITYTWDFGDDSGSNEANPTHVYAAPGTYTVTLTAVNEWETAVVTGVFVVHQAETPATLLYLPIILKP